MKENSFQSVLKHRDVESNLYFDYVLGCYTFEIDHDTFYYETIEECVKEFIAEVDIILSEDF